MKTNRLFVFLFILVSFLLFNDCANEKEAPEPENTAAPSCAGTESAKPEGTASLDNITITLIQAPAQA